MKLNWAEKALMNNPVRAWLQWHYEAPLLLRLGGSTENFRVLEIGCGRGVGTEIILEHFRAGEVHAFDIDPGMVELARNRLSKYPPDRVHIEIGNATHIAAADDSFDAVFDFGIIHHIPEWKSAIAEVRRVLKPGGKFYFEEVTSQALGRWFYCTFLTHPTEDRFTAEQFISELERQRIRVGNNYVPRFFGDFVVGVGECSPI